MSTPILGIISIELPVYVERYRESNKLLKDGQTEVGKYVILTESPDIKVEGVDFEDARNKFRIEYAQALRDFLNRHYR